MSTKSYYKWFAVSFYFEWIAEVVVFHKTPSYYHSHQNLQYPTYVDVDSGHPYYHLAGAHLQRYSHPSSVVDATAF